MLSAKAVVAIILEYDAMHVALHHEGHKLLDPLHGEMH